MESRQTLLAETAARQYHLHPDDGADRRSSQEKRTAPRCECHFPRKSDSRRPCTQTAQPAADRGAVADLCGHGPGRVKPEPGIAVLVSWLAVGRGRNRFNFCRSSFVVRKTLHMNHFTPVATMGTAVASCTARHPIAGRNARGAASTTFQRTPLLMRDVRARVTSHSPHRTGRSSPACRRLLGDRGTIVSRHVSPSRERLRRLVDTGVESF